MDTQGDWVAGCLHAPDPRPRRPQPPCRGPGHGSDTLSLQHKSPARWTRGRDGSAPEGFAFRWEEGRGGSGDQPLSARPAGRRGGRGPESAAGRGPRHLATAGRKCPLALLPAPRLADPKALCGVGGGAAVPGGPTVLPGWLRAGPWVCGADRGRGSVEDGGPLTLGEPWRTGRGLESWICLSPALWPWPGGFPSLGLCSPVCNTG